MPETIYYEDLSDEWKQAWRERRMRDLEVIETMRFSCSGTWGQDGLPVRVLGPAKRFPPYNACGDCGVTDNFQVLCEWQRERDYTAGSSKSILMARSVFVDGRPLLVPCPPRRPALNGFFSRIAKASR